MQGEQRVGPLPLGTSAALLNEALHPSPCVSPHGVRLVRLFPELLQSVEKCCASTEHVTDEWGRRATPHPGPLLSASPVLCESNQALVISDPSTALDCKVSVEKRCETAGSGRVTASTD